MGENVTKQENGELKNEKSKNQSGGSNSLKEDANPTQTINLSGKERQTASPQKEYP